MKFEGAEKAWEVLKPHWGAVQAHFNQENQDYLLLITKKHDVLGRVLKCHLVIEHYLNRFLSTELKLNNLEEVRLTFAQKARLLPKDNLMHPLRDGVLELNTIRNKFAHKLKENIDESEIKKINYFLRILKKGSREKYPDDTIGRIEIFTTHTCTWLMPLPPELKKIIQESFSHFKPIR